MVAVCESVEAVGASLLHRWDHIVLSFQYLNLFAEFLKDDFGLPFLPHLGFVRLIIFVLLALVLLALLTLLLLLIFELLGVQNDGFVSLELLDEGRVQDVLIQQTEFLPLRQRKHAVLRLQVSVDYATHRVHVVETQQNLLGDAADHGQGDATVVVLLDQAEQVLAEQLEGHHEMFTVDAVMEKLVEHLEVEAMLSLDFHLRVLEVLAQELRPLGVPVVRSYVVEDLFFFERRLCVLISAPLNLESVQLLVGQFVG